MNAEYADRKAKISVYCALRSQRPKRDRRAKINFGVGHVFLFGNSVTV